MYVGLDREYALLWSEFTTILEFPRCIIEKYSNSKFHENPSSINSCFMRTFRRKEGLTYRQRIMTKIIAAFHDFEDAPKKSKNLGLPFR